MKLRKSWRKDLVNLHYLLENSIEVSSPWNECLVSVSQDDKTSVSLKHIITVEALVRNSTKVIVPYETIFSVCDRDFTAEKFIPPVNCWMNVGTHIGELMKIIFYVYSYYFY